MTIARTKKEDALAPAPAGRPSSVLDTRVVYCGDNLDQLRKLPDACVDLIYIDPPFNSNRNYEVFWGETKEKRAFDDRHASTQAYIEYMRPRCIELARVLKQTRARSITTADWHASHYVKVMLDQIFGENQFQSEIIWKRQGAPQRCQTTIRGDLRFNFFLLARGLTTFLTLNTRRTTLNILQKLIGMTTKMSVDHIDWTT